MLSFLNRLLGRKATKTQQFAHPYAVAGGAKQGSGPRARSKVSKAKAARKRARASRQKNRR